MRRVISGIFAAVLLLLAIADVWLWHRGYTTGDTVLYAWARQPTGFQFLQVWTSAGGIRVMYGQQFKDQGLDPLLSWNSGLQHGTYSGPNYPYDSSVEGNKWTMIGFEYYRLNSSYPHLDRRLRSATFPHAALLVALAAYPSLYGWRAYRRRGRHGPGFALDSCLRDSAGSSTENV